MPSHLERRCEACGHTADDLVEHEGGFWCPTVQRCDYNQNIGWINADIQAGIDAEMGRAMDGARKAQAAIDADLERLLTPEARERIAAGDREFTRRVLFGETP